MFSLGFVVSCPGMLRVSFRVIMLRWQVLTQAALLPGASYFRQLAVKHSAEFVLVPDGTLPDLPAPYCAMRTSYEEGVWRYQPRTLLCDAPSY